MHTNGGKPPCANQCRSKEVGTREAVLPISFKPYNIARIKAEEVGHEPWNSPLSLHTSRISAHHTVQKEVGTREAVLPIYFRPYNIASIKAEEVQFRGELPCLIVTDKEVGMQAAILPIFSTHLTALCSMKATCLILFI